MTADFLAISSVALALLPQVGRFASTVLYVGVGDWQKARGVSLWRDLPQSFLECEIERGTEKSKIGPQLTVSTGSTLLLRPLHRPRRPLQTALALHRHL